MRKTLSASLVVRNEEERPPDALARVSSCDEIVVADSGSIDSTVVIARAAGARVVENSGTGCAAQRNVGLDHATCDWILEVDAHECVSPTVRAVIPRILEGSRGQAKPRPFARRIDRIGMFPPTREPQAERRLGAVGALLLVGWRARILVQLVPRRVRGMVARPEPDEESATAVPGIAANAGSGADVDRDSRRTRYVQLC
jgi:Glycosyl transferase family 2